MRLFQLYDDTGESLGLFNCTASVLEMSDEQVDRILSDNQLSEILFNEPDIADEMLSKHNIERVYATEVSVNC